MSAASHSPASERPLRLLRRLDLQARPEVLRGETVWTVKDPLARRYFHLSLESWWLLTQLDGAATLASLQQGFEQRFFPQSLPLAELESHLAAFHRQGLVVSDAPGQSQELLERAHVIARRERWGRLLNPLAIRFRGVDPSRWLQRVSPGTRWLFSRTALCLGLTWILSAFVLLLTHFEEIRTRLPAGREYLAGSSLLLLALALGMTKIAHELGHALVCRHLGADCHELGVMLLVFTPCLYCDVSDAWMLPNRWHRAAVGLAGIWIDLLVAATAGWLWWFSQPGVFHELCGRVVLVCSLATLAFNANPLMRYDGYYVLSDLLGVPNLAGRAHAALACVVDWCLGNSPRQDSPARGTLETVLLAGYAVASWCWQLILCATIVWVLAQVLAPHGLLPIAALVGLMLFAGLLAGPVRRAISWWKTPGGRTKPVRWRQRGVLLAALSIVLGLALYPWPYHVRGPAVIEPLGAVSVYVSVPGTLRWAIQPGERVAAGESLARLENLELELETDRLVAEVRKREIQLANLRLRQGEDPLAASAIPTAEQSLQAVSDRLERHRDELQRLTVSAPISGLALPPPDRPVVVNSDRLAGWAGSPLEARNQGAWLERGTLVCQVGPPREMTVRVLIDQEQLEFITPGQTVEVLLDQAPWTRLAGELAEISEIEIQSVPPALARHADLPQRVDEQGISRPMGTVYQARVNLAETPIDVRIRQTGRARIRTSGLSWFRRMTRWIERTLGFESWKLSLSQTPPCQRSHRAANGRQETPLPRLAALQDLRGWRSI